MAKEKDSTSLRWLIPVALLSGFVGFLVYLDSLDPDGDDRPPETTSAPEQQPEQESSGETPRFKFYEMLPDSEVATPDIEAYRPDESESDRNLEYILQAGSFQSREDAERQRAQVGFQGLRARISEVSVDDGGVWYRVMVGPFDSRSRMNQAVDRLVEINIQPMVRRRNAEGEG
ncbi:SPOR domain-containing protein [Halovibrio salipaludis]|uniref:SPOR domain-containing protein n=1 Tax=Halovibrio salipaludis TaxID=2032626 RepID=UPI0018EA0971|nr:SPOR domain-containing protein [Halovibrio salipaludis]